MMDHISEHFQAFNFISTFCLREIEYSKNSHPPPTSPVFAIIDRSIDVFHEMSL